MVRAVIQAMGILLRSPVPNRRAGDPWSRVTSPSPDAKSFLSRGVTQSQVPGIRAWPSLGTSFSLPLQVN